MTWSFIHHITEYLGRPGLDEQKAPTLWPSEAASIITNAHGEEELVGKCRRSNYFRYVSDLYYFSSKWARYEPWINKLNEGASPPDVYTKWIWKQGEIYEQYCVDLAKESGVYIATQVSVYVPELNISGKLDLIVVDPETHKYHIVEVKSVYGFNSNSVVGTAADHKKGILGKPRDSHLMQIGIYQWWYGNPNDYGPGLLVYGSRDTGRYGEYLITVEKCEDGKDYIFYQGNSPITTEKVNSGISIQSVCAQYKHIIDCANDMVVPERDYELLYSDERLDLLYSRGELSKTDTAQYEKRKAQIAEGKEKVVKQVEKGDWQCSLCQYKNICYDQNSVPKDKIFEDEPL
ncbi:PD-(D/E)XK nuclease superfamily [uncultured Caudovirales phage]|uniref:PD-(D/E)XK nuclease superfamily n=1 Tax=uncultured Caudovirales phage TaxID=2100421 RepID=A0A6J5NN59_9CAUD|nr:PD-(D/E)XK nuclease superfamily [uncultured Caudovirales phage]